MLTGISLPELLRIAWVQNIVQECILERLQL